MGRYKDMAISTTRKFGRFGKRQLGIVTFTVVYVDYQTLLTILSCRSFDILQVPVFDNFLIKRALLCRLFNGIMFLAETRGGVYFANGYKMVS